MVGPLTTAGLGSHTDWHWIFISLCAQKPVETAHHAPLVVVWLVSLVSGGGAALVSGGGAALVSGGAVLV